MRLPIVLALALTNVIFCSSSFAAAGRSGTAVNIDNLDRVSTQLHHGSTKSQAIVTSKKNAQ